MVANDKEPRTSGRLSRILAAVLPASHSCPIVKNTVADIKARAAQAKRVVLPSYVVPSKYDLTITPNLEGDFKYKGELDIDLSLGRADLQSITLHSVELQLEPCTFVSDADGAIHASTQIFYDEAAKTVTIVFDSQLAMGPGKLNIKFTGEHNNQMAGFYRSKCESTDGEPRVMLSTHFEPLNARRCFPCVDEPAVKATFQSTLIIEAHLTALANMPESSCERFSDSGKAMKKVRFQETPLMSTYLVAFCVGEFDFVSTTTEHGVRMRVYTPAGQRHLGQFALNAGKRCLDLYGDTFGLPFPLPKMDMIAIPEFPIGAMENFGLVTYRSSALLIDDVQSSSWAKQRVYAVVAHELAHQWFGNLVTMEWWDDLYLKEGFASWMENFATQNGNPDWGMWEQFIINHQASALNLDALTTSHAIQMPIKHAEEVEQTFDAIAYMKGASVVRMMHAFIGKEDFIKGLQLYMHKYQYGNATTAHLSQAWQEASGKPATAVMQSWTEQMGFPVVTVKSISFASKGKCVLELHQEWFLADGSHPADSDSKMWMVPLFVAVGDSNGDVQVHNAGLMKERTMTVTVPAPSGAKWARMNAGQHVPMRVMYSDPADLASLRSAVESKEMISEDRAGLVMDALALTKAGRLDASELMHLLSAFKNEDTMAVWNAIESALSAMAGVLADDDKLREAFGVFAKDLVSGAAARVGWTKQANDGHLGALLRTILVRLQGTFMRDDFLTMAQATARFNAFMVAPTSTAATIILPVDLRQTVYRLVLAGAKGPEVKWRLAQLRNLLEMATTVAERMDVYSAIGAAPNEEERMAVLKWSISGEVLLQDFFIPMGSVASSDKAGRDLTFEFLKQNFDTIHAMLKTAVPSLMARVVRLTCGGFNTVEVADEIESFFAQKDVSSISRAVEQVVEGTRVKASFRGHVLASEKFKQMLA